MSIKGLSCAELDEMRCANTNCDHSAHTGPLILASYCHPESGQKVIYRSDTHTLIIRCKTCDELLVAIAVAKEGS